MRVQAPLPDRYTEATPEELSSWIRTAKAALGDRLDELAVDVCPVIPAAIERDQKIRLAESYSIFSCPRRRATDREARALKCPGWRNQPP